MAQINLVCRRDHPHVQNLARALRESSHQVRVVETYKMQSMWKTLRHSPFLLTQKTDIWHFVYSTCDETPSASDYLLLQLARQLKMSTVLMSLFSSVSLELSARKKWQWRFFLDLVPTATFADRESLMYFKRQKLLPYHIQTSLIPPLQKSFLTENSKETEVEIDETPTGENLESRDFFTSLKNFWVWLGEPSSQLKRQLDAARDRHVFLTDLTTRELDPFVYLRKENFFRLLRDKESLQSCLGICIANQVLSAADVEHWVQLCIDNQLTLVVDEIQWQKFFSLRIMGDLILVENQKDSFLKQLKDKDTSYWQARKKDYQDKQGQLLDFHLNELNRLYQQALN